LSNSRVEVKDLRPVRGRAARRATLNTRSSVSI